ncbi:MAG: metallophosphoesterase [Planctomycetota bacterium]
MNRFLDEIPIDHPSLPAAWDGLRILHISDLHARGRRRQDAASSGSHVDASVRQLAREARNGGIDMIAITGDSADGPRHTHASKEALEHIAAACEPKLGIHAVFGNHLTSELFHAL